MPNEKDLIRSGGETGRTDAQNAYAVSPLNNKILPSHKPMYHCYYPTNCWTPNIVDSYLLLYEHGYFCEMRSNCEGFRISNKTSYILHIKRIS